MGDTESWCKITNFILKYASFYCIKIFNRVGDETPPLPRGRYIDDGMRDFAVTEKTINFAVAEISNSIHIY